MLQILANGLVAGGVIGLLAFAFQIVYLPTRVFFLGLAGVYSAAPFVAYWLRSTGSSWTLAIIGALLSSVVIALLCEVLNHSPLARRRASDGAHLISSLGIYLLLVQIVAMIWGNDTLVLRRGVDSMYQARALTLSTAQIWSAVTALVLLSLAGIVLLRTGLGLRLRALADNAVQFELLGYDVARHRRFAFAFSGALTAAAGLANAYDVGFSAHTGLHAFLLAVVAVIVGGRHSFLGPLLGGVLLGLIRAQAVWTWSAKWQEVTTFVLLAMMLLFRPLGIVGRKPRLEAVS